MMGEAERPGWVPQSTEARGLPAVPGLMRREEVEHQRTLQRVGNMADRCVATALQSAIQRMRDERTAIERELFARERQSGEQLESRHQGMVRQAREEAAIRWQTEVLARFGEEHRCLRHARHDIAGLLTDVLRVVVGRMDTTAVYTLALDCLDRRIDAEFSIVWRVHPGDETVAQSALDDWHRRGEWDGSPIRIVGDTAISRGNCEFSSGGSSIGYGLDVLLGSLGWVSERPADAGLSFVPG